MAGLVALAAALLGHWEHVRPKWSKTCSLDVLSARIRRAGLALMWLEALLMAIGSQLPTQIRSDRLLFVSIWAVVCLLAALLVVLSISDSIVRLMAQRVRAAALSNLIGQELREAMRDRQTHDDEFDEDTFDQDLD